MTTILARMGRRRPAPAPRPRPRIVTVTDYWRTAGPEQGRRVLVHFEGELQTVYLPDDHPALVAYLDRAHAAAVSA